VPGLTQSLASSPSHLQPRGAVGRSKCCSNGTRGSEQASSYDCLRSLDQGLLTMAPPPLPSLSQR
jgi:hypothetical protein